MGLFLIWRHNLCCMHVYKELMWCKSVCDVKWGIDPLPFWLGRERKMLGFSQVLKPIKWQDLSEDGKNGCIAFRTGAKIHWSEKNILRLGALSFIHSLNQGRKDKTGKDVKVIFVADKINIIFSSNIAMYTIKSCLMHGFLFLEKSTAFQQKTT